MQGRPRGRPRQSTHGFAPTCRCRRGSRRGRSSNRAEVIRAGRDRSAARLRAFWPCRERAMAGRHGCGIGFVSCTCQSACNEIGFPDRSDRSLCRMTAATRTRKVTTRVRTGDPVLRTLSNDMWMPFSALPNSTAVDGNAIPRIRRSLRTRVNARRRDLRLAMR
jgi:hypothetical protein